MATALVRHGAMREDSNVVHAIEDGYGTTFNSTTIQAAVTALGATKSSILLTPGTWTIASNLTVPDNIVLEIPPGAMVTVNTGVTLITRIRCDERQQCFSGPGQVFLAGMSEVYPQWFGAVGNDTVDCLEAYTKAIFACPQGGAVITVPGTYRYTGTIIVNKEITFRGTSRFLCVLKPMTPTAPGVQVTASFVRLSDFSLQRTVHPTTGGDGIVAGPNNINEQFYERLFLHKQFRGMVLCPSALSRVRDCIINFSDSHGMDMDYGTNGGVQWYISEMLVQHSMGSGIRGVNSTAASAIGPFLIDCHVFNSGQSGYYFQGDATHQLNDVWLLRCVSSCDSLAGIIMHDMYGELSMVHDCWVELTGRVAFVRGFDEVTPPATLQGHGMSFTGVHNNGGVNIVGGLIWSCSWSGLHVGSTNIHPVGVTCLDNGQSVHASLANRAGIVITAVQAHVSSCSLIRNAGNNGQSRGIVITGNPLGVGIDSSNSFSGYTAAEMVDTSLSVIGGNTPLRMPLGLIVHTGKTSLVLTDETGGVTPNKPIGVAAGHLQFYNNAVSQVLLQIRDNGVIAMPSTTGAFIPNKLTTGQRDTLPLEDGMIVYNSTTGKFQGRAAGVWVDLH